MRRVLTVIVCLVLISLDTPPAAAHHSTANYDSSTVIRIEGVVSAFVLVNPHTLIEVDVIGEDGEVNTYKVFFPGKSSLLRTGWTPDTVKLGDAVSVFASPNRRDPFDTIQWRIIFADGSEWNFADIAEESTGVRRPAIDAAIDSSEALRAFREREASQ
jgi:hypothetical protein